MTKGLLKIFFWIIQRVFWFFLEKVILGHTLIRTSFNSFAQLWIDTWLTAGSHKPILKFSQAKNSCYLCIRKLNSKVFVKCTLVCLDKICLLCQFANFRVRYSSDWTQFKVWIVWQGKKYTRVIIGKIK